MSSAPPKSRVHFERESQANPVDNDLNSVCAMSPSHTCSSFLASTLHDDGTDYTFWMVGKGQSTLKDFMPSTLSPSG